MESRAQEWRKDQIWELCADYGWPSACCHSEGCDILLDKWERGSDPQETPWMCLEGLHSDLMRLEANWNNGAFYEALEESFFEDSVAQAGLSL